MADFYPLITTASSSNHRARCVPQLVSSPLKHRFCDSNRGSYPQRSRAAIYPPSTLYTIKEAAHGDRPALRRSPDRARVKAFVIMPHCAWCTLTGSGPAD